MKLFKNPFFALFLCLAIVFCSTCLNAKIKMENRYEKVCDRLYDEVIEYANDYGIDELKVRARDTYAAGDYRGLISSFSELSAGMTSSDTEDVDDAIKAYNKFIRDTQKFPATVFVDLWNLSF